MQALWIALFIIAGICIAGVLAVINRRWNARIISEEEYDVEIHGKLSKKEREAFEAKREAEAKLTRMPFGDAVKERPGRFAASLFLGAVASVSLAFRYDISVSNCILLAFLLDLILIAWIDLDTQMIPFPLNVFILCLAVLSVFFLPDISVSDKLLGAGVILLFGVFDWLILDKVEFSEKHWGFMMFLQALVVFLPPFIYILLVKPPAVITDRLIGMMCVGAPLILLNSLMWVWKELEAFGFGDIKLLIAAGALLGWKMTVIGFFMGAVVGGVISVILLIRKKKGGKDHIPFGPSLCIGLYLALMFGIQLVDWYTEILKRSMGR